MNLSLSSYVVIENSISGNLNTYLLDTGANISTLKESALPDKALINVNNKCKINGIVEGLVQTLGSIDTNLSIDGIQFKHQFQVVDNNFPVPSDGIIGLDFIKKYNCILDFNQENWKMILRPSFLSYKLILPISTSLNKNSLILPARCEVIRKVNLKSKEKEILVYNQEISQGIFVGRTIVSIERPYVRILNTTNEIKILKNVVLDCENLSNYRIFNMDSYKNTNRSKVIELLQKNFPSFAKDRLTDICTEYQDIFALETDTLTVNNFYKQKLRLKDDIPVYIKNYRIPQSHKEEIDKKVEAMLENGTIEPSISEYNSPVLLVPKKSLPGSTEKKWRFCVDFRQLNKKLLADKFPLPRMDDLLDQLGQARYFSSIDLLNGFFQIGLEDESKNLTSFSTDKGSFRFNSIPFGLKIGPNSFQRMMSIAFSGLSPTKCFIYMDDLIIVAPTENKMISNIVDIFQVCRKYNLKLNPQKCRFFLSEVTYLGHKCTDKGILPDESKFEVIKNYPKPTDADSVRRFVAFCNYYRRFVENFAHYACHLTRLTRKNVNFVWSDECEKSFQYLKKALIQPTILQYPDFSKPFCITTDASKIACGAVFSQTYDGIELPISYASRSFTKGESNKSTIEQE